MRRRTGIASGVIVVGVLLFGAAFVLQHAGLLQNRQDRDGRRTVHPLSRRLVLVPAGATRRAVKALAVAPLQAASVAPSPAPQLGRTLLAPRFSSGTRLVTNDYAYFNASNRRAVRSSDWIVTSGSLFARHGAAWTGIPDAAAPNARSTNGTGSATFRVVTRVRNFGDVAVSFDLLTQRFVATRQHRTHSWDGVHVFLHYRSQHSLYVVTVNRRDNVVLVKKKRPGGPANGGTYYTVGSAVSYTPPLERWQHVLATIGSSADHTTTIALYVDGRQLLGRMDTGVGGDPLTQPGAVGIRGDDAEFEFANFRVRALR
jgi:hypothetical protein